MGHRDLGEGFRHSCATRKLTPVTRTQRIRTAALLDDAHLEQLDRTQAFLVSRGILPQPVDLNAWAAPEFLARIGSPA